MLPHAARGGTGNLRAQRRVTPSASPRHRALRRAEQRSPATGPLGARQPQAGRPPAEQRAGPAAAPGQRPPPGPPAGSAGRGRRLPAGDAACDVSAPPRDVAAEAPARRSGGKRAAPCWLPREAAEASPPRPAQPRPLHSRSPGTGRRALPAPRAAAATAGGKSIPAPTRLAQGETASSGLPQPAAPSQAAAPGVKNRGQHRRGRADTTPACVKPTHRPEGSASARGKNTESSPLKQAGGVFQSYFTLQ